MSGYLGNVPLNPSIAVSFKTLEMYRRIQLRKPSFSVEAFAKVTCDLYSVSSYDLVSVCQLTSCRFLIVAGIVPY